jgi:ATP-dependent DNA helicase RecQ
MPLNLIANPCGDGWDITTQTGVRIGAVSKQAKQQLAQQGMDPARFQFFPGEATVRSVYHHIGTDSVTGIVTQDHFVVLPQIRVVR